MKTLNKNFIRDCKNLYKMTPKKKVRKQMFLKNCLNHFGNL